MRPDLRTVLHHLDRAVLEAQRRARRALRRAEAVRLVGYRGWVTREKAVVLGRAIMADVAFEAQLERSPRLWRVAYERFGTVDPPPLAASVAWQGRRVATTSDTGGFIDVSFPLEGEPPRSTTSAEIALDDASTGRVAALAASASAEVFSLHPQAAFGIISDIDDTVLETELTNPWKRALQLIYSEQRMRLPFDGIAALYQAFAQQNNPIFYVSNAPWNLYAHVVELLDHHDIPKGPLLLRDSRIAERIVVDAESGEWRVHKQRALQRLVEDHPGLSFVLLGDSSRRDPLRYVEVAEAHPGRVAAIYIRRVQGLLARRESLEQLRERARRAGVDLVIADDTVTIAAHARSQGFVPAEEVGRVREAKREDEQKPSAELSALATELGEDG